MANEKAWLEIERSRLHGKKARKRRLEQEIENKQRAIDDKRAKILKLEELIEKNEAKIRDLEKQAGE